MKPALTVLLLLAACASAGPRPAVEESSSDRAAARADEQHAEELERTLSALSAGEVPDCARLCGLVEQICELSQQICAISGRHRDDPDLAARCAAGEQRCRRSRDRIPPACSCQAR